VALALVALPAILVGLIAPKSGAPNDQASFVDGLVLLISIISLAGQLALIRLALGPAVTVGEAIAHGFRRLPAYLGSALIILAGFIVLALPFALVMAAMGQRFDSAAQIASPAVALLFILFAVVAFYGAVRMLLTAPVASAEAGGPLHIARRSWTLTAGHFWRLLGFLLLMAIGAALIMLALSTVVGALAVLAFGAVAPWSLSALVVALVTALFQAAFSALFAVMVARLYAQVSGHDSVAPISGT
jgi:hypothetical protein